MTNNLLPFSYKSFGYFSTVDSTYYGVTFTKDFGVIKAGWSFESVSVNYREATMTVEVDGKEITQSFKLEPIYTTR